ncbi:hypothetical protein [Streptomyces agglomeratus]|uniref:hypothetical protein n=1 Tax=Streptomyces agglomeratus TaxID=285458 RepID=UPI00114C9A96|nr:hypothetical protein [Streptomyces agglomeratus]
MAAVVGLTACSSSEPEESAAPTSPSPLASAPASTTPTASASPKALTREEAGKKYLELVKPVNAMLDKCYFGKVLPLLESGGSTSADFPKIRKACAGMGKANRTFADDLEAVKWPAAARKDVGRLIDEKRADQLAWEEIEKVRTHEDLFNPKYPLTDASEAAALVRAHLGLPPRSED